MNIKKEITDLVLNKYKLKVLDPLSIKSQVIKLCEELEELKNARTIKQVECELGDVFFVERTLWILLDKDVSIDYYDKPYHEAPKMINILKGLNKCDSDILYQLYSYVESLYIKYDDNHFHKLQGGINLTEQTILKNQGRSGKVVNGCYVKSEDV